MLVWTPGTTLADVERQVILTAFSHYKIKNTTAAALGIGIRTLDEKLKQYKQEEDEEALRREQFQLERRANAEKQKHGTLAVELPAVDIEEENEKRRQYHARERAEGRANVVNVTGLALSTPEQQANESKRKNAPGTQANAGVPLQSADEASKKQSLPVQERTEVQKVLPAQAPASRSIGRR